MKMRRVAERELGRSEGGRFFLFSFLNIPFSFIIIFEVFYSAMIFFRRRICKEEREGQGVSPE